MSAAQTKLADIARDFLATDWLQDLACRWEDEGMYEDWSEYDQAIRRRVRNMLPGVEVVETSGEPFEVLLRRDGATVRAALVD